MANRQIFQLTSKTIANSDFVAVQDSLGFAEAKKVTVQNIVDQVPADSNKLNVSTFNSYSASTNTTIISKANKALTRKAVTANYTLIESDNGLVLETTNVITITIPTGLSVGFQCMIVNYDAADPVTFVAGSGATVNSKDGNLVLSSQFGAVTLYYRTATEATLVGDLTA